MRCKDYIQEKLEAIRRTIMKNAERFNVDVEKIILFGSRARGDYRDRSDWDILIIIKGKIDKGTLDDFWLQIKRELVENGVIPEIIIVNADDYSKQKHLTGYLYYWAEKEGIILFQG